MQEHTNEKYGICEVCGKQTVLPCEVCQAEALRWWQRTRKAALKEEPKYDLSVRLENPELQKCYEEVRNFRDTHGYPMFSEKWKANLESQLCSKIR